MTERTCKVLFLGDTQVGKTALFRRITEGAFCEDAISTLGADFSVKNWTVDNISVMLQIWDTAGQERFHATGPAFYRGTDACMIVFDLTSRETFERVGVWMGCLEQRIGTRQPVG